MTRREIVITRFLRSRGCAFLTGACALGCAVATYVSNPLAKPNPIDYGVAFPSANDWFSSPILFEGIGWALNLTIAALMILLNRSINLLRTVSVTYASVFLLMQAATPDLTGRLCDGVLLALTILVGMGLIQSCYLRPERTPRVFLAFFLLGTGFLWRYSYATFIPAFLLGLGQMRIFSMRSLTAALLGLVAPIWIAAGSGLTNPLEWPVPGFDFDFLGLWGEPYMRHSLFVGGVTLAAAMFFFVSDIFKILSYNAATRAYNGLLMTITLTTGLLVLIDWHNLSLYLSLLNAVTSCLLGHFLKIHGAHRAYLVVSGMMIVYFSFYLWNLWILI